MTPLRKTVEDAVKSGSRVSDLVILIREPNQKISQEASKLGVKVQCSQFVPYVGVYILDAARCNKALAWSLGYRREEELVSS